MLRANTPKVCVSDESREMWRSIGRALATCPHSHLNVAFLALNGDDAATALTRIVDFLPRTSTVVPDLGQALERMVAVDVTDFVFAPLDVFKTQAPFSRVTATVLREAPLSFFCHASSVGGAIRRMRDGDLPVGAPELTSTAVEGDDLLPETHVLFLIARCGDSAHNMAAAAIRSACQEQHVEVAVLNAAADDALELCEQFAEGLETYVAGYNAANGTDHTDSFYFANAAQVRDRVIPAALARANIVIRADYGDDFGTNATLLCGVEDLKRFVVEHGIDMEYLLTAKEAALRSELRARVNCIGVVEALLRFLRPFRAVGLGDVECAWKSH